MPLGWEKELNDELCWLKDRVSELESALVAWWRLSEKDDERIAHGDYDYSMKEFIARMKLKDIAKKIADRGNDAS